MVTPQTGPPGLLFMCVANSARSQMAEGFARLIAPAGTPVFSAGSAPSTLNPVAVRAMKEVGIDISKHNSKGVRDIPLHRIGTVVTLCADSFPAMPAKVRELHWPIPDPMGAPGSRRASDEDVLNAFRDARDRIREHVSALF